MEYSFRAKVWRFQGSAGWFFVTLPKTLSKTIRQNHGISEEGWGRLKTTAQIGETQWNTAIWYDTKAEGYLLPIKAAVRKREKIETNSRVSVRLEFENEDPKSTRWRRYT
ncbi:MAG: DUF1905 domain-containing protein [Bdellovibrionaceae bacterium]|nr:DUF1905 domain-containing protein [Pseudobdellovibrionaceae bacterium]